MKDFILNKGRWEKFRQGMIPNVINSYRFQNPIGIIQDVSKRALQLWKLIEIYTEDIHKVLNCQNVAKYTEFYLE